MFDEPIMYASPPDLTKFENLEKWYQFLNTSEKLYDLKQCLIYDFNPRGGGGSVCQSTIFNGTNLVPEILMYQALHVHVNINKPRVQE